MAAHETYMRALAARIRWLERREHRWRRQLRWSREGRRTT
jgi:hypothetical protein